MSAFLSFFKPKPGSFGQNLFTTHVNVGTVGGTTVAGSTTTSVALAKPFEKCYLKSIAINCTTVCLSNGGTVTAQVLKGASTAMCAVTSIEADVLTANTTVNVAITATIAQRVFATTDAVRVDVVAGSTIDTQPVIAITAVWAMMN